MARTPRSIGTFASVFLGVDGDGQDDSDYRAVPRSDRGNAVYSDKGMRGSYAPANRQATLPDPKGLVRFTGYGADEDDLRRGFIDNCVDEDPAYDLINYKDRSVVNAPNRNTEDFENTQSSDDAFTFRMRNRRSRGFLTRPHIPTER